jgi:hypothetical protein
MPRHVTSGTPSRAEHYPPLRPRYAWLRSALALGAAVVGLYAVFELTGLRGPLSPARVSGAHSNYDSRCQACHVAFRGAVSLRCQRCHDTGGGGRLTQAAHVFFGSGDARKAAASERVACARCHVEHLGSQARLSAVDQSQCLACHAARRPAAAGQAFRISSLSNHPEFKVLRDNLRGDPRMLFSHKRHMKPMLKAGAASEWDSCTRCHVPDRRTGARDFEPIVFETHCQRCHTDDLAMEAVVTADVQLDAGLRGALGAFNRTGDSIQRAGIRHKDEWVLFNLRKLQFELYPDAYAQDRAALLARASQLERRLYQADALAGLPLEALRQREAGLQAEIARLAPRLEANPAGRELLGAARLQEVLGAVQAAGDTDAKAQLDQALQQAKDLGQAQAASAPLSPEDFDARRRELLTVLDVMAAADRTRTRTLDDLRRRLLALQPGEPGRDNLDRALRQRRDDLERVRDEIALRQAGVAPENLPLPERDALRRDLDQVRDQLAKFYRFGGPSPALSESQRQHKEEALKKLTGLGAKDANERCAKCHRIESGSLSAPRPARSVMVRAAFAHRNHLIAPLPQPGLLERVIGAFRSKAAIPAEELRQRYRCAYCHAGIEQAGDPPRKPAIPSVAFCRDCHRSGGARHDCALCHRYHPTGASS